jgi:hypothetical protein
VSSNAFAPRFAPRGTRTFCNGAEVIEVNRIELGPGYAKIRANYVPLDAGQKEIMSDKGANELSFYYPTGATQSLTFTEKSWIVVADAHVDDRPVEINANFTQKPCSDS